MDLLDDNDTRIEKADAIFIAVILEGALMKMKILEGCNKAHAQKRSHRKLRNEQLFIEEVNRKTLIEIINSGTWKYLHGVVNELLTKSTALFTARSRHNEIINNLDNISDKYKSTLTEYEATYKKSEEKIAYLKDLLEDTEKNTEAQLVFSKKWLDARQQELKEPVAIRKLPNIDHEIRVHKELLKAYDFQIKDLKESVEKWIEKYKVDITLINKKLEEKKEQLKITTTRRQEMAELYKLHDDEIRAWLSFKKERAAKKAKEEQVRHSAICIQSWWRGVMVRKGFGSYRYLRNLKKPPAKTKKRN